MDTLEALVDPLVSGIHAGDPEQLSVRACFPALVQMVDEHGSLFAGMRAKRKQGGGPRPGLAKPRGGIVKVCVGHQRSARKIVGQSDLCDVARSGALKPYLCKGRVEQFVVRQSRQLVQELEASCRRHRA